MIPIIGAILMPIFSKLGSKVRDYIAVSFVFLSLVSVVSMVKYLFNSHFPGDITLFNLISFPDGSSVNIGVLIDPLSVIICLVVTFLSFLIAVYSLDYMHGDPGLTRYWFFFLFFIGNMLLLVTSDNLLQLFIGWEGVSICSYGLIGYYYRDEKDKWVGEPSPNKPPSICGMKAFVMISVGDALLLAAIIIIFHFSGTLNLMELIESAPKWMASIASNPGLLTLTTILFLAGPIGKSAQFPLHEWLPEAMAGPSPVSALIHAATMVKAGVYLVARMSPAFYVGYFMHGIQEAQVYFITIACIGALTAFMAASQALVSNELKKILAYSTISQIGYMMLGLGVSGLSEGSYVTGLTSGIFHLMSHALFKAALFLCAGSVIHSMGSIYISNMGGLRRYMPITFSLMVVSTLSLSGISPLNGFWSKDSIFETCLDVGTPLSMVLLAFASISAVMTFFYGLRCIGITFYGPESEYIEERLRQGHGPHEVSRVMWGPVAILVFFVVAIGLLGLVGIFNPYFSPEVLIEHQMNNMLNLMKIQVPLETVLVSSKISALGISAVVLLIGGASGWVFYIRHSFDSWELVSSNNLLKGIHKFLLNRWYIDAFYKLFVNSFLSVARVTYIDFESGILDKGLNVGVPDFFIGLYNEVKKFQSGILSFNIIYVSTVFMILILWMIEVYLSGGM